MGTNYNELRHADCTNYLHQSLTGRATQYARNTQPTRATLRLFLQYWLFVLHVRRRGREVVWTLLLSDYRAYHSASLNIPYTHTCSHVIVYAWFIAWGVWIRSAVRDLRHVITLTLPPAPATPHGRLARWRKWKSCDVGEAKEGLENELWRRWSNVNVGEWAVT